MQSAKCKAGAKGCPFPIRLFTDFSQKRPSSSGLKKPNFRHSPALQTASRNPHDLHSKHPFVPARRGRSFGCDSRAPGLHKIQSRPSPIIHLHQPLSAEVAQLVKDASHPGRHYGRQFGWQLELERLCELSSGAALRDFELLTVVLGPQIVQVSKKWRRI